MTTDDLQQIREAIDRSHTQGVGSRDYHGSSDPQEGCAACDALAALARVEATLNELKAALLAMDGKWLVADLEREDAEEALAAAEARVVAAEAERDALVAALAPFVEQLEADGMFDPSWDDTPENKWYSGPNVTLKMARVARNALAAVSATGASGALQDTARPAPAEPPREKRWYDAPVEVPAEPPERPETSKS